MSQACRIHSENCMLQAGDDSTSLCSLNSHLNSCQAKWADYLHVTDEYLEAQPGDF